MQSDGNSYCGDVVLDSFNIIYSDEDSISDQTYESESFEIVIRKILNIKRDWRKFIFKEILYIISGTHEIIIIIFFFFSVVLVCIFV